MKAIFNGAEHDFRIADINLFESTIPAGSAFAMLVRFTNALWSASDVAHVISWGLHGPGTDTARFGATVAQARRQGMPVMAAAPYAPDPDVVSIVNKAPAEYIELATSILTETLFGTPGNGNEAEAANAEA